MLERVRPPLDQRSVPTRDCSGVRDAPHGGGRRVDDRHQQVPTETVEPSGLSLAVYRRPVGSVASDIPTRRLRLLEAGGGAAADGSVDDLPNQQRSGDHGWSSDAGGAEVDSARLSAVAQMPTGVNAS